MLLAALGRDSGAYQAVEILHILAAIVGFGGLFLSGVYLRAARGRGGQAAAEVTSINEFVMTRVAFVAIYLVPILGIALVGMSDKAIKFSQGWVSAAFALYIVALGVLHGLYRPAHHRLSALLAEPSPDAGAVAAAEKRIAMATGINHVLVVVILCLMVVGPS